MTTSPQSSENTNSQSNGCFSWIVCVIVLLLAALAYLALDVGWWLNDAGDYEDWHRERTQQNRGSK